MTRVLEVERLSKTFPGQRALDGVSLDVEAGEVHALVGQNGAGKSTLIKILAGFHDADPGARVAVEGEIGFVHQDLGLVPTLSAAENIALVRGFQRGRGGGIRWRATERRARELIAPLGVELDVSVPVQRLAPVQRAIVAMARATQGALGGTRLLVLDEPTAALPAPEVERLLSAVRRFASGGGGVLYVSHRLDEVFAVADRVTVLRNGRWIATEPVAHLERAQLVVHMLGRELAEALEEAAPPGGAEGVVAGPAAPNGVAASPSPVSTATVRSLSTPVLRVRELQGARLRGLSFDVAAGEVLGVAGIVGSGREELAGLLFGATTPTGGAIAIDGDPLPPGSPRASLERGVAFVPADRARDGLVPDQVVRENMLLPRIGDHARAWGVSGSEERSEVARWAQRLAIDPPDPEKPVRLLSGGNQQKVVFARALGLKPRLLILDEPGQGVDVGARRTLLRLIGEAARDGVGVVFCTSEIEDLPGTCHRVLVLRGGVLAQELSGEAIDEQRVLAASMGGELVHHD